MRTIRDGKLLVFALKSLDYLPSYESDTSYQYENEKSYKKRYLPVSKPE
jgi:hypothetical protein